MKTTIFTLVCLCLSCWAYTQNITVQCPPCRPIAACNQCWESQQQALANCGSNARTTTFHQPSEVLKVLPNPTDGVFTVQLSKNFEGVLTLINHSGQTVRKVNLRMVKSHRFKEKLAPGLYHVIYTNTRTGKRMSQKVLIR
jgi:hypothetical protein